MAKDKAPPPDPESAEPKPPEGPDWSKFTAPRLFRPLSAMEVPDPPKCVKCEKPTFQCCDGTLAGERAGFVPICRDCYVSLDGKLPGEPESPSQES